MPTLHRTRPAVIGIIAVCVIGVACDTESLGSVIAESVDLVGLKKSADAVDADGVTAVGISARIPSYSTRVSAITFTTDGGTFVGSAAQSVTVPVDASGNATVSLRAPRDPGTAIVRALAGRTTLVDSVRFIRTLPDTVLVDLGKFSVLTNEVVTVSAVLRRRTGLPPTRGTVVSFAAWKSNGAVVGVFGAPTLSDSGGVATVRYSPTDTSNYAGPIVVRAAVRAASGALVSGESTLFTALPKPQ